MTPPETHEVNEHCADVHKEFHRFRHDMENQKDGIICTIYKHMREQTSGKVKMKTFLSVIGTLCTIAVFGIGYTYSVDKQIATKEEIERADDKLEKKIIEETDRLDKKIDKVEDRINEKLDRMEETIIDAIKEH